MAISTTSDPIILQVVETHASTIPGEEELTKELKNQAARMLETCYEHRQEDVLQTATRMFTESVVHLHTLLCLQEGVHHTQWPEAADLSDTVDDIDEKRRKINETVDRYMQRQVRRFITIAG